MLTIHFANRTERLAGLLVEGVGSGAPFTADEVIVPSAALRRYLTLAIARRHGICANVRFGYLAQSLWQWIARVVPGVQAESPFAPGVLAWRIFAAFDDPAFGAAHPRLNDYLVRSDAAMRFQLAQQVAGVFDQYITYRPQWLAQWSVGRRSVLEDGAPTPARADEAWQAALWRGSLWTPATRIRPRHSPTRLRATATRSPPPARCPRACTCSACRRCCRWTSACCRRSRAASTCRSTRSTRVASTGSTWWTASASLT
jgi:exonuclease V gamma subunit